MDDYRERVEHAKADLVEDQDRLLRIYLGRIEQIYSPLLPAFRFRLLHSLGAYIDELEQGHYEQRRTVQIPAMKVLEERPELGKIMVTDLGLSNRVLNTFMYAELVTVEDLIKEGRRGLLKYRNFGRKCLKEVEEALARHGLMLDNYGSQLS